MPHLSRCYATVNYKMHNAANKQRSKQKHGAAAPAVAMMVHEMGPRSWISFIMASLPATRPCSDTLRRRYLVTGWHPTPPASHVKHASISLHCSTATVQLAARLLSWHVHTEESGTAKLCQPHKETICLTKGLVQGRCAQTR